MLTFPKLYDILNTTKEETTSQTGGQSNEITIRTSNLIESEVIQ